MSANPITAAVPATPPSAKGATAAPAATSPFAALLALLGGGSGDIAGTPLKTLLAEHAAKTGATDRNPANLLDDFLTSNGISLSEEDLAELLDSAGEPVPAAGNPTSQSALALAALQALASASETSNATGAGQPAATTAPTAANVGPDGDLALPEALRAALNALSTATGATTSTAEGTATGSPAMLAIAEDGALPAPLSGRSAVASIEQLFGRAAQQVDGAVSGQGAATTPEMQSFADRLLQHAMARQAQAPDASVQALMQAAAPSAAGQGIDQGPIQTSVDLNAIAASGLDRPVIVVRGEGSSQGQGALPLTQIAVTIQREASNGRRRFEIQLDPPDLGRIDVRLEMTRDGRMITNLTVDRPETLDHLMRDARQLERALMNTGLKLDDNGLQFSLRDQGQGGGQFSGSDRDPSQPVAWSETSDEADAAAEPAIGQSAASRGGASGLDLTI